MTGAQRRRRHPGGTGGRSSPGAVLRLVAGTGAQGAHHAALALLGRDAVGRVHQALLPKEHLRPASASRRRQASADGGRAEPEPDRRSPGSLTGAGRGARTAGELLRPISLPGSPGSPCLPDQAAPGTRGSRGRPGEAAGVRLACAGQVASPDSEKGPSRCVAYPLPQAHTPQAPRAGDARAGRRGQVAVGSDPSAYAWNGGGKINAPGGFCPAGPAWIQ